MKLESLVTVNQLVTVNTFSGFVLKIKCAGQRILQEGENPSFCESNVANEQVARGNSTTEGF